MQQQKQELQNKSFYLKKLLNLSIIFFNTQISK